MATNKLVGTPVQPNEHEWKTWLKTLGNSRYYYIMDRLYQHKNTPMREGDLFLVNDVRNGRQLFNNALNERKMPIRLVEIDPAPEGCLHGRTLALVPYVPVKAKR